MQNTTPSAGHSPACAAAPTLAQHILIAGTIHAVQHRRTRAVYRPVIALFGPNGRINPVAIVRGHDGTHATCDCDQFRESWDCAHIAALADSGHLVFTSPFTPSEQPEGGAR